MTFTETSTTTKIQVCPAADANARAWDEFVENHPEGRFCHLWAFRETLERVYGYKCAYFDIYLDGSLCGIFPSIVAKRGSARLISQPFQEYGGPLLKDFPPGLYEELCRLLLGLATEHGCQTLEFRGGIGCDPLSETSYCRKHPLYQYAVLPLENEEFLWRKSMAQEARKGINKARESGLNGEIRRGRDAVAKNFHNLYLASMKRLGVPPHGEIFFTELARNFGEKLVASWVQHQGQDVAVLIGLVSGQRIQAYITASEPEYWNMRPNDLAHWELMLWAQAKGLTTFDFGSARYPGQIHYKKKWGCIFHEYSYYLLGKPGSADLSTIQTVDSSSGAMARAAEIWEKYVPLPITKIIGPHIRKYLTK